MKARIHQQPKSSMQSGRARVGRWLLEFEPAEAKHLDPLTGWSGSGDTAGQVLLTFDDLDAAVAYATAAGIDYDVIRLGPSPLKLQAYADNFR
ncbi:MAG: ETC complex I subunit [Sphingomonadaceae bacterium]|nr:ETC complex I subunit [Sphingomonadaceae bacterium]